MKVRPTDWEQLISDYHKDNSYIRSQQFKWLTPKERTMGKLPNRSEMSTEDAPADQFQGGDHNNASSSNKLADPGANPKKKAAGGKPPMSPVRQVMKAVTNLVLNPRRKKATSKGSGDKVMTQGEDPSRPAQTIYKNNGGK